MSATPPSAPLTLAVVGATGDVGRRVVTRLCDLGYRVIATSRSPARLTRLDRRAQGVVADFTEAVALSSALARADRVINIAHAATIEQLLPLVPPTCERLIVLGSTRRDSTVPDPGAQAVRRGEAAFLASGKPGCMLHPTMIYGGQDEQNVRRITRLVDAWPRWLPLVWPLPDGGKALVQPVHIDDVAAAIVAAATVNTATDRTIVVAGPQPITLGQMVRACAASRGRRLYGLPLPTSVFIVAARLFAALTRRGPFSEAEIRRVREDKAYDIGALETQLGVIPRSFQAGLRSNDVRHAAGNELGCSGPTGGG